MRKKGIIETERVIYSEDGTSKKGVIKEQYAKVTKRKSMDAENIDPDNRKRKQIILGINLKKFRMFLNILPVMILQTKQIFWQA